MNAIGQWERALALYDYHVDLRKYSGREAYEGWFDLDIIGDRNSTMSFETRFRQRYRNHRETWFEVVYWKMFSFGTARDRLTSKVATNVGERGLCSTKLAELCESYCLNPSSAGLCELRSALLKGGTGGAPLVATFPAFLDPERFPMVDKKI